MARNNPLDVLVSSFLVFFAINFQCLSAGSIVAIRFDDKDAVFIAIGIARFRFPAVRRAGKAAGEGEGVCKRGSNFFSDEF